VKLLYASTARLPTVLAHGLQIVENCAAFAAAGAEVTLMLANRRPEPGLSAEIDPRDHYRVPHGFAIERVSCLEPRSRSARLQASAFRVMAATFGIGLLATARRAGGATVIYSRDALPLLVVSALIPSRRLVYEAHQLPISRRGRALHDACVRRAGLVVAVTDGIASEALAAGARAALVARDGYRAGDYAALPPPDAARRALGLPPEAFIVGYVGQLHTMGMAKGVEQLVDAVARLRDIPITLAVVGGPAAQVEALRERWRAHDLADDRLVAPGRVLPERVPLWLAALDVGTMPFPSTPHFAHCASPMKMFEYLAAGLPIVASDLPALAEVLVHGETALLTPPADVEALAFALRRLRDEQELRTSLAGAARRAALGFTWSARAESILDAMGRL